MVHIFKYLIKPSMQSNPCLTARAAVGTNPPPANDGRTPPPPPATDVTPKLPGAAAPNGVSTVKAGGDAESSNTPVPAAITGGLYMISSYDWKVQ